MPDNTNKVKGRVHPEDSWTDYGCGDCGDYADNNGCRGPRGKVDLSSIVITNKTTTNWVYQVVLDLEKLVSNHISLPNSYIGISFYGIPLIKLGNGPTTVFELYEEKEGSNIYSKDNLPPIVKVPNETIKAMIPVKQVVCQDI